MIVAVLGRHAGVALASSDVFVNVAGGVRIEEPGADLAVALAIASAARGVPVREGFAAFGEIGLTGRLRQASQSERRLEECAKLGVVTVVVPTGTTARSSTRLAEAETLQGGDHSRARGEIAFRGGRRVGSDPVALPLIACEERAMM